MVYVERFNRTIRYELLNQCLFEDGLSKTTINSVVLDV